MASTIAKPSLIYQQAAEAACGAPGEPKMSDSGEVVGRVKPSRRPVMRPVMNHLSISAVRADALFVSSLQRSDEPSAGQVRQSIAAAVRQFGGRGCAGRVAQEFGEHPELAAARMRWAQRAVAGAFGGPGLRESGQRRAGQQPAGRAA